MPASTKDAVVAGSREFAVALLAPLTERLGTRPRVAAEPAQALALAGGAGPGLLVVEVRDEGSLGAIRDVLRTAVGLAVVAAVPAAHAAAEEPLRALGVEVARWNGTPEGVLQAVARRIAATPAEPAGAVPAAPFDAAALFDGAEDELAAAADALGDPAGAAPATAPLARGLFDDADDDFDVDVDDGTPALAAPEPVSGAPWPTAVPGAAEAAGALERALAGDVAAPGSPLAAVAGVVAALTDVERSVLAGEPHPIDVEPVRRAAVMRVRVAAALATAPAPGGEVDAGAVSAFLAEIDALLADVSTLAEDAPDDLQGSLAAVRNALVKEAIDFSEAAQRAGSAGEASAPAAAPARAPRAAARARVVSVASRAEQEAEARQTRRHRRLFAVLGVSVALAAAFHGYGAYVKGRAGEERPVLAGAPADATVVPAGVPGAPVMVRAKDGGGLSDADLTRLSDAESLKGNVVRQLEPGTVVVLPGAPAGARERR